MTVKIVLDTSPPKFRTQIVFDRDKYEKSLSNKELYDLVNDLLNVIGDELSWTQTAEDDYEFYRNALEDRLYKSGFFGDQND